MNGLLFVLLAIGIACLIAWLMAISQLVEAARMKGHCQNGDGMLWFIGIFASPIVLGLYTASLPDRAAHTQDGAAAQPKPLSSELPPI